MIHIKTMHVLSFMFFFISCKPINSNTEVIDIGEDTLSRYIVYYTQDSVRVRKDELDLNCFFYSKNDTNNIDSIWYFYRDTIALSYAIYNNSKPTDWDFNKLIGGEGFFRDGNKQYIRYEYKYITAGDTASIYWHENGNILSIAFYMENDSEYPVWYQYYNTEGIKDSEGQYVIYNAVSTPGGTWSYYDSLGMIYMTNYFHNDIFEKSYILEKLINNGKIVSEKIYQNYVLYESEEVELDSIP